MLWIEDIVKRTPTPPFLTNSRIDMVGFVNPHKVVAKNNALKTLPNIGNGGEFDGRVSSVRLKC